VLKEWNVVRHFTCWQQLSYCFYNEFFYRLHP